MLYIIVLEKTVNIAKVGTESLRATVPEGIVSYLIIPVGHKLEWRMDTANSQRIAIVSRKRFRKKIKSLEESLDSLLRGKQTNDDEFHEY